jgi:hypothetical protein
VLDPRATAGGDESLPIRRRAPMPLVRQRCDAVPCTRQGATSQRASSRSPFGPARRERRSSPRRAAPFARWRPKSLSNAGLAPKRHPHREHLTEARHSTGGAIGIASAPARASTGASSDRPLSAGTNPSSPRQRRTLDADLDDESPVSASARASRRITGDRDASTSIPLTGTHPKTSARRDLSAKHSPEHTRCPGAPSICSDGALDRTLAFEQTRPPTSTVRRIPHPKASRRADTSPE